ncbi:MAG: chorismate synthase [Spirochaetales bacterium]|nr:chorismate synthase [Spirochaetales bacterium]
MSRNSFGTALKITTFGESHGVALGVVIDGLEAGFPLDLEAIQRELDRRRPGGNPLGTTRNESDTFEILSGVFEGKTTGTPLAIIIRNTNQRSDDYNNISNVFRPGHADYTWHKKFGMRDWRGGGRSSGRETAARLAAGAIARQILATKGIEILAYTTQIGDVVAKERDFSQVKLNYTSTPDKEAAVEMAKLVERMREEKNSVGGIIECRITGLPAGLGEPVFDKADALLSHAIMSIGAIKGIEIGEGFKVAYALGSQNNDQMGKDGFLTNHAGGVNGGITNGEPLIFRVAVKPTASIEREQKSLNLQGEEEIIKVVGRHDPSICIRIVPVIEAMSAVTLLSLWYDQYGR